jgi:processing peptidase subunit alpha
MYSRLYREVMNAFSWAESANAFSAQLYDCGLVGIYGAAPPEHAGSLANILMSQLVRIAQHPAQRQELQRAQNQLASSVMMNLETRGVLCEDIGRQILSHGKRLDPAVLLQYVAPPPLPVVARQRAREPARVG